MKRSRRQLMLLACLVAWLVGARAQEHVVHVAEAGTLEQLLAEKGLSRATQLTITGELNGTDIRLLRQMAGGCYLTGCMCINDIYTHHNPKPIGCLKSLDLSGVSFVSGGDWYVEECTVSSTHIPCFYTQEEVFGDYMLNCCFSLEDFVLPSTIQSVGSFSLMYNDTENISVPERVSHLGHSVFSQCDHLKSAVFPATLKSMGIACFYGCTEMKTLTCLAATPPTFLERDDIFQFDFSMQNVNLDEHAPWGIDVQALGVRLYVPKGTKEAYLSAYGWKDFGENLIEEIEGPTPTAIHHAAAADGSSMVCAPDGTVHATLSNGLNIVRDADGQWRKVMRK